MAAMPANLDTDLLRAFVAVAETRSFTRAADTLYRTQSAVSQQIRRLEDTLGCRVFARDTRGVRLTGEGETLLAYARRMLSLNDEVMANLGTGRTPQRPLRLGTPDDYAYLLLPPVLARFAASHPHQPVEVVCDNSNDLALAVEEGAYDLALITRPVMDGVAGDGIRVRRERLVWTAAPSATGLSAADPLPLAVFPEGCVCRSTTIAALAAAGRAWRPAFISDSVVAIHGAVLGGVALTPLEACTVPPGLMVLGDDCGLPPLPAVDIVLLGLDVAPPPARALGETLLAVLAA